MAVPDFQSLMLPLLRLTGDKAEHMLAGSVDALADQFGLTPDERAQMNAAGRARTFYNRVAWASTCLRTGVLMESTGRGRFRITNRGMSILESPPQRIDIPYLMRFEEFRATRAAQGKAPVPADPAESAAAQTPEELFESSFQSIRTSVEADLLARVKAATPAFFEELVVELIVAMGYGGSQDDAGKAIGKSGDGGIGGVIKEDRLGLDTIYLQAKRWDSNVGPAGRPGVRRQPRGPARPARGPDHDV